MFHHPLHPYCCKPQPTFSHLLQDVFPSPSSAPLPACWPPTFFRTKRRTNFSILPFELPLKRENLIHLPSCPWLGPQRGQEPRGAGSEATQEHQQCELTPPPAKKVSSLLSLAPSRVPKASDGLKPFSRRAFPSCCLANPRHLKLHPRAAFLSIGTLSIWAQKVLTCKGVA